MTEKLDRSRYLPLKRAVEALAGVCDGAVTRDENGYSGPDASMGHLLAFLDLGAWPPAAFYQAWLMLRKYRQQLSRAGISYDDLPEPPCLEQNRYIAWNAMEEFQVLFPYDSRTIVALGRLPGAHLRREPVVHWVVEATSAASKALLTFVERYRFVLAPDADQKAKWLAAEHRIGLHEGSFAVYFDFDPGLNAEIKAIRCWHVCHHPTFHWCIPAHHNVAWQGLRHFVERHPEFVLDPEAAALLAEPTVPSHRS